MTNNNYIKYKLLKPQKFSTSKLNTSNSKTFVSPNNKIHSNKIKPPTQNKLYNIINPLNHNNENDIDKISQNKIKTAFNNPYNTFNKININFNSNCVMNLKNSSCDYSNIDNMDISKIKNNLSEKNKNSKSSQVNSTNKSSLAYINTVNSLNSNFENKNVEGLKNNNNLSNISSDLSNLSKNKKIINYNFNFLSPDNSNKLDKILELKNSEIKFENFYNEENDIKMNNPMRISNGNKLKINSNEVKKISNQFPGINQNLNNKNNIPLSLNNNKINCFNNSNKSNNTPLNKKTTQENKIKF